MALEAEDDREIIDEQIDYYERRAPEYDETSTPEDDPLVGEERQLIDAMEAFGPRGRILEIACGTGTWTSRLSEHSGEITALDASPRMVELNRQKVNNTRIEYVITDIFGWKPEERYDVVFFANWLSHVPPSRFEQFWSLVREAVAVDGRVFFVDEAEDAWRHEETLAEEFVEGAAVPLVRRTLRDGSAFRVVKVFWNPADLRARLRELGWSITVGRTGSLFWGAGARTPGPSEQQPHVLSSPRLRLQALTAPVMEALLADDRAALRRLTTMNVPAEWPHQVPEDRRLLELRLEQLRARPGIEAWLVRALVDANGKMVGHAGFHYPPAAANEALEDPTYRGERLDVQGGLTEMGYTIFPAHRGRGLATEAAGALVEWAFETMHVGGIIACASPANIPSIRVLERIGGFRQIGHCLDERGDRELVFRRDRQRPDGHSDI